MNVDWRIKETGVFLLVIFWSVNVEQIVKETGVLLLVLLSVNEEWTVDVECSKSFGQNRLAVWGLSPLIEDPGTVCPIVNYYWEDSTTVHIHLHKVFQSQDYLTSCKLWFCTVVNLVALNSCQSWNQVADSPGLVSTWMVRSNLVWTLLTEQPFLLSI